jgi:hypothetical protein
LKIFLFILFTSLLSVSHAHTLNSKQMKFWHKLLHYHTTTFGQVESEVDSPSFFVSEFGKVSPVLELDALIEKLNSAEAQSYVCKFPLRYRWLKQNIPNSWTYTTQSCEIYNSFVGKLDAKNISLVFSSFYINNPGSTFGHTFLRVGRYDEFHNNDLLDYAINFAAEDAKDNPVLYMMKGLAGYYPGRFSVMPYYYKIREYNDHEFRDIWDYDLGLDKEQISRVVDHIWEMGSIHFDYFYFTENCSYHILGLLNVAYDDVDILAGLSSIYVLPIDTVKEMKKLDLIKDRKVRVSAYGKLLKETEGLSNEKLNLVKAVAQDTSKVDQITKKYNDKEAADLLDASISALDYLKAEKILLNDKKTTAERDLLLEERAINPHISETLKFDVKKMYPPDESHDSSRLGIFAGDRYEEGAFTGLEWRAAQHELLDPSQGQLKSAQVVIFDIRLRYQSVDFEPKNVIMDRFRAVDLKKYQPSDFWNSSVSFDLGIGLDQRKDCKSHDCIDPTLTFGVGNSTGFSEDVVLTFLLGGTYVYDKYYENDSLLSLGPKANFLILKDSFSVGLDAAYFLPTELFDGWLHRRITYDLDFRYFLQTNTSLFFKTSHIDQDVGNFHEAQVGVYFYH